MKISLAFTILVACRVDTTANENFAIQERIFQQSAHGGTCSRPSLALQIFGMLRKRAEDTNDRDFSQRVPILRLKGGKLGGLYHRSFTPEGPWAEIGGKVT